MPASLLLGRCAAADAALARVDAVLAGWEPAWPQGHATARLVEEYLQGRASGVLDVSGRPWVAAIGTAAEAPATAADTIPDNAAVAATPSADTTTSAASDPVTVVLDDPTGALVLVAALTGALRVHAAADSARAQDAIRRAIRALPEDPRAAVTLHANAADALRAAHADAGVTGTGVRVLVDAPKQLAVLRAHLRTGASTAAEVVVAGREKHLSPRFNGLLDESFREVHVSPGQAKSRLLVGVGPKRTAEQQQAAELVGTSGAEGSGASAAEQGGVPPSRAVAASPAPGVPDIAITAWPGTFGGAAVDPGSRLLVRALAQRRADLGEELGAARRVLDLGCGNGWLLAAVGALLPGAQLWGVDDARAAVLSARRTVAEVTDQRPVLLHQDGTLPLPWPAESGERIEAGAFDLVTLNPPFHEGHAVTTETAQALLRTAARLLAPGGRLVVVHNSHLRYRPQLERLVDGVEQWARDRRFTVISGIR